MSFQLPTTLTVNGREEPIRYEYTAVLDAISALNDRELEDGEKLFSCLFILYENFESFGKDDMLPAFQAAMEFINNGLDEEKKNNVKLVDFEQDARIMIPAINRVAGKEIRNEDNIHWWTFLGWFMEIGDCTYSTVLNIRTKKSKNKQLEKWEQDFYKENRKMVDIQTKLTEAERRQLEEDERLLKEFFG